jgi:alkylhydroperoxidase/carboxymuconolactone decarboxylase family protein YurZ
LIRVKPLRIVSREVSATEPSDRRSYAAPREACPRYRTLSEVAVHSHTRRALAEGISKDELKQVALLAIPTLGFPQGVKALTWIEGA